MDRTLRAAAGKAGRVGLQDAAFYLDQQVSNSGRLSALLREGAETYLEDGHTEMNMSVDKELYRMENVVTSDAIILDNCVSWYNPNKEIIGDSVEGAWILSLRWRSVLPVPKEAIVCCFPVACYQL